VEQLDDSVLSFEADESSKEIQLEPLFTAFQNGKAVEREGMKQAWRAVKKTY
jgi:hypothetical protein